MSVIFSFMQDHAVPAQNDCDNLRQELFVTNAATCGAAVIPFHRSQYRTGINGILNIEGCPALYGRFTAACSPIDPVNLYIVRKSSYNILAYTLTLTCMTNILYQSTIIPVLVFCIVVCIISYRNTLYGCLAV